MKIKLVKVYQSVVFDNKSELSFTPAEYHSTTMSSTRPRVKIEHHEMGVLISNDRDCVLVGWPNIAYIQYDMKAEEVPVKGKKGA